MKTQAKCLPCILTQVINAMRFAQCDEAKSFTLARRMMEEISEYSADLSPACNSSLAFLKLYKLLGNDDPYADIRRKSNTEAQTHYERLERLVEEAEDKLFAAVQVAVSGNIIDLGIKNSYNLEQELALSLTHGFARNDYPQFTQKLGTTDKVLVLADNSGEIVFDKLLVSQLLALGKKVIYMVKGAPIINDAVLSDARETGMDRLTEIATTGAKFIGFEEDRVSPQALELFDQAGLVIAKGMANFETLHGTSRAAGKSFCVLKAKCELVAQSASVRLNELVFAAL